jgi:hypothetical protein
VEILRQAQNDRNEGLRMTIRTFAKKLSGSAIVVPRKSMIYCADSKERL